MKHALFICLISGLLAAGGCYCGVHPMACHPFGPHIAVCDAGDCYGASCGPACESQCGPVCKSQCGPACEPCGDMCCEPCCDPCGYPCGPLTWLVGVFARGYCGPGCGGLYWSDFHNEPPDCCDPCDRCGNWTGGYYGEWYGRSPQCENCQNGYCASGHSQGVIREAGPSGLRHPEGYVAGAGSSQYAPRLLSVTDRAVSPTLAKPAPVQQAAQPRRASPRQ